MVQMNLFAGQKLRRRCREQTLDTKGGHPWTPRGESGRGWWWWDELGDWDDVYTNMYKMGN